MKVHVVRLATWTVGFNSVWCGDPLTPQFNGWNGNGQGEHLEVMQLKN